MKKDGFFVTLNHPVRSNSTTEEFSVIRGYDAVEICNPIAVTFNNFSDDSPLYENDLRAGGRAVPVAADDCHKIFEDGSPFCEYYKSFTLSKHPN